MVKFVIQSGEGTILGLGLSRLNLERLEGGEPILVDLSELGWSLRRAPKGAKSCGKVLLMVGDDEQSIGADLGFNVPPVKPGEQIYIRPRGET